LLGWFARRSKVPGWFAATVDADTVTFVHAHPAASGKWTVSDYGARRPSELHVEGHQCTTVLADGEYQLLLVEAPDVPAAELKSAMRWKVKDLVDYRVEDATIDMLDIPPPNPAAAPSQRQVFAVAARNDLLQGRIRQLEAARVPLAVIDIRETAQRNLAALYETPERGLAFIHLGTDSGLLTINFRGELYLARRVDVRADELVAGTGMDEYPLERVALEIQRTLDHFDRQFRHVAVGKLVVGPTAEPTRLAEFLGTRIDLPVQQADLREVLDFADAPDEPTQSRLFHHFGAALRRESGAGAAA
jgi:MSHA biogenesis protein MshI